MRVKRLSWWRDLNHYTIFLWEIGSYTANAIWKPLVCYCSFNSCVLCHSGYKPCNSKGYRKKQLTSVSPRKIRRYKVVSTMRRLGKCATSVQLIGFLTSVGIHRHTPEKSLMSTRNMEILFVLVYVIWLTLQENIINIVSVLKLWVILVLFKEVKKISYGKSML